MLVCVYDRYKMPGYLLCKLQSILERASLTAHQPEPSMINFHNFPKRIHFQCWEMCRWQRIITILLCTKCTNWTPIDAAQLVNHPTPTATKTQLLVKHLKVGFIKVFQGKRSSSRYKKNWPHVNCIYVPFHHNSHSKKWKHLHLNWHSLFCLDLTSCANKCDPLKPESRDASDFTVQHNRQ